MALRNHLFDGRILVVERLDGTLVNGNDAAGLAGDDDDVTDLDLVSGDYEEHILANVEHEGITVRKAILGHVISLVTVRGLNSNLAAHRKSAHTRLYLAEHAIEYVCHYHFLSLGFR